MKEERRSFIKRTLEASAIVAAGSTVAMASSKSEKRTSGNGVVIGKSPKKEVLYKQTAQWEAFYKASY
ncbi:Tat pathway signal protein [Arcobacter sp. CECT 8986]|uniref:twin-arginine translocation signal domain-containing protein n=1 Tax=Arcobacter sp. CECT 8986 TaxID=2044507 RepID=UPI0010099A7A|nr:twin-arginine translocation signal domain-containing protein [Arcobacter sp. CECT 8986]RXK00254.1 Tat pathway signal protein [Arcobacter sp. CECT 8986]RXK00261.1 Tat pathway signal protein [Arcobacter sp. CECT 8986]